MSGSLQQLEVSSTQLDELAKNAAFSMNESDEKTQFGSTSLKEVLSQQQQLVKIAKIEIQDSNKLEHYRVNPLLRLQQENIYWKIRKLDN